MGPGRGGWKACAVRLPVGKWDEWAVRDDVLAYAREQLGEGSVLVFDETGSLEEGLQVGRRGTPIHWYCWAD